MAQTPLQFYQQEGIPLIQSCLQGVVGQPPEYVADAALYRMHVIDRGWDSLPEAVRLLGRHELRWDEIFLGLRLRVFSQSDGRVCLLEDTPGRIAELLAHVLGGGVGSFAQQTQPGKAGKRPDLEAAARQRPPGPPALALGIDLGTTFSVVAYLDAQGRPTTIRNQAGDLLTPSVVLFDEAGIVVGKEALLAGSIQPGAVAECVKRDMGAKAYRKGINGKDYPPEVVSAFILCSLKDDAERTLGPVAQAVITVPAYFDEGRRRATMDAGRLAGLDVLDIINEPTAAALAYGYQLGFLDWRGQPAEGRPLRVLAYDLGGGTFDVTIIQIEGKSFTALATDGDVYLGGKDWDERLVGIVAERLRAETGQDPRSDPPTLHELWLAAEAAKRTLSERPRAAVFLNHAGKRHKVEVSREEFEEATADLLTRTRNTTELVARQANLTWKEIDKVLLVGGATRMPAIVRMLSELTGRVPDRSVSPDESVAHGAALYADLLLQRQRGGQAPARFSLSNVCSHSLGIVILDEKIHQRRNEVLIPKNTPLPASVTKTFRTVKANQQRVAVRVLEGESERPEACAQVGVCTIEPLPANLPRGHPVEVTYAYQDNGRLAVTARLEGHQAAATYLLRENRLDDTDLRRWAEYVSNEWKRREQ